MARISKRDGGQVCLVGFLGFRRHHGLTVPLL